MKKSTDYRSIARDALMHCWGVAVFAGLIMSILGTSLFSFLDIQVISISQQPHMLITFAGISIYKPITGWNEKLIEFIMHGAALLSVVIAVILIMTVIGFVLKSIVSLGYARFNLDLLDKTRELKIRTLFSYFAYWKTAVAAQFLRGFYVLLWSLLFIFPGIIAGYSYAMTGYILAEHPELTAKQAIQLSKRMMNGNKFRLFCLHMSFFGWILLTIVTFGVGVIWLNPYMQAANVAFYRDISAQDDYFKESFNCQ